MLLVRRNILMAQLCGVVFTAIPGAWPLGSSFNRAASLRIVLGVVALLLRVRLCHAPTWASRGRVEIDGARAVVRTLWLGGRGSIWDKHRDPRAPRLRSPSPDGGARRGSN